MSLVYDSVTAEKLLRNMNTFCENIKKDVLDLMSLSNQSVNWRDSQNKRFNNNITDIAKDIQTAFNYENEYKRVFGEKIRELRE